MTITELAKTLAGVPATDSAPQIDDGGKIPYAGKEVPHTNGARVVAEDDLSIPDFCKLPAEVRGTNDKEAMEMGKQAAWKLAVPPASAGRIAKVAGIKNETHAAMVAARRKAIKMDRKRPGNAAGAAKAEKAAKIAKKANGAPKASARATGAKGTKMELIRWLLTRKSGCTTADILAATGWPSVTVPGISKALGLTLRKERAQGEVTRYYGGVR